MKLTPQRDRAPVREGVNPGGQVGSADITEDTTLCSYAARNVLLDRTQLEMRGPIDTRRLH